MWLIAIPGPNVEDQIGELLVVLAMSPPLILEHLRHP